MKQIVQILLGLLICICNLHAQEGPMFSLQVNQVQAPPKQADAKTYSLVKVDEVPENVSSSVKGAVLKWAASNESSVTDTYRLQGNNFATFLCTGNFNLNINIVPDGMTKELSSHQEGEWTSAVRSYEQANDPKKIFWPQNMEFNDKNYIPFFSLIGGGDGEEFNKINLNISQSDWKLFKAPNADIAKVVQAKLDETLANQKKYAAKARPLFRRGLPRTAKEHASSVVAPTD
jgi:hypothetical protein